LFWQQACVVDGFCDVNVDGVQCFSYRQRRWWLFGGESGAQQPVVDDFDDFARSLAEAPCAGQHTWKHNSARVFSLHQACYELRLYQRPPRKARPSKATLAQRMQVSPREAATATVSEATPFVVENTLTRVSCSHGAWVIPLRKPPHRSTTFRPSR
jgi:hypothetical protein